MRVLACLVLCLAFSSGFADTPVRSPNCEPPERPSSDAPEFMWDQFRASVENYRVCISTYVERNQSASDSHRAAANQATLFWNEFVHSSLNAPRDYPKPKPAEKAAVEGAPAAASVL
jgi:hypothetical protein